MARAWIRLGDKTSHGGVVIQASAFTDSGNIRVARVGDLVKCPKKGHGTCPIVSGDNTLIVDGKPVARHGDKTSCGASLIASQQNSTADQLTSAATAAVTSGKQELSFEDFFSPYDEVENSITYDDKYILRDSVGQAMVNTYYAAELPDGDLVFGTTDAQGHTDLFLTGDSSSSISFYIAG